MNAIGYLWIRSIKNKIKETLHKPGILILYLLLAALLVFVIVNSANNPLPVQEKNLDVYACILVGMFLFILLLSMFQGLKQGAAIFSMPDVNFLFTAPVSPRRILIYAVCKQAGILVLASAFLLFQFPNLRNGFGLDGKAMAGMMAAYVGLGVASQMIAVNIYAYCASAPQRRARVEGVLKGIMAALVLAVGYSALRSGDVWGALRAALGASWWDYIPVVGWARGAAMAFAIGRWGIALVEMVLLVGASFACILLMQRAGMDYFEDVLVSAEQTYQKKQAAKEGRLFSGSQEVSKRVKREAGALGGHGAWAFTHRIFREQSRRGIISWLLDLNTLCAIGAPLMSLLFIQGAEEAEAGMWSALSMAAYLMLFFNLNSSFNRELTVPYIYLAPGKAFTKLLAIVTPNVLKGLLDGAIFGVALLLLLHVPVVAAIAAFLCYASIAWLYTAGLVLIERVLGGNKNKVLIVLVYFLGLLLLIAPGLVLAILLSAWLPLWAALIAWAAGNTLLALLILFLCRNLLAHPEVG